MIVGGFDENAYRASITGTVGMLKGGQNQNVLSNLIYPLPKQSVHLPHLEITARVSPGADRGFATRFETDMREQLNIGPYFFSSVTPMSHVKKQGLSMWGETGRINGVIAVVVFLLLNIFLGIMGTFWFRTQSRRQEIGLRMALGSSRRKVTSQMMTESLLLLSLSVATGLVICLNIANTDLLAKIGIPDAYYQQGEISVLWRGIRNLVLSFGFLALISVLAVWYPARQASRTQPAEALRSE